jgi:S-adenosylmethionine hydrolase
VAVTGPRTGFVSLTTDFGAAYTSICAGVIYRTAPGARVLVLSDEVPKYAILAGAMLLRQALPYFPVGIHVGIVDPGVGTPRRPVALVTRRGDVLVGPDNGLLRPAAERLGGLVFAYLLENPDYRLPEVSTTFHGRDIFAPAAGHLATGVPVSALGPALDPGSLRDCDIPAPTVGDGVLTVSVLYVDEFGSVILSGEERHLRGAFGPVGYGTELVLTWDDGLNRIPLTYQETFGAVPVGEPLLFRDSSGWLGVAVNQGSAAERFGIRAAATVTVTLP